ncbi:hypothetical protein [Pelosinus sp. sgz500959]|uniref:hypothetical protein n=1 Tax=Pelosinus sp. sgz500959 TaxID=3242472 RepID=UPI00366FCBD9
MRKADRTSDAASLVTFFAGIDYLLTKSCKKIEEAIDMAGAPLIWVNSDKSEQIAYFNNEYVLITITDMKKISLGETVEGAKEKLKEIGRCDIAKQLERDEI